MLQRSFENCGRVHRFLVTHDARGWNVVEEEGTRVILAHHHDDWRHVERDILTFQLTAHALERDGWVERES